MQEAIKLFIGTCPQNKVAQVALRHSIIKNCSMPVEIIWMSDIGNHPVFDEWDKTNWGTEFTAYRWAIPYLCGFKGRALYIDVDTVVLGDIAELWKAKLQPGKAIMSLMDNYSVMVMDCNKLKYPVFQDIDSLKEVACVPPFAGAYNACATAARQVTQVLPPEWNCLDGDGYMKGYTRLIHFTNKDTQPWQPYPEKYKYKPHPRQDMVEIWFDVYSEAINEAGTYTLQ